MRIAYIVTRAYRIIIIIVILYYITLAPARHGGDDDCRDGLQRGVTHLEEIH